jgi:hypothetical protein
MSAAGVLALLSLRSMAFAFSNTVDAHPNRAASGRSSGHSRSRRSYLASGEAAILMLDVLLSVGIALAIVGLASMAALPGRWIAGALLAQVAVIGSLIAPPQTVSLGPIDVRPAAIALGIAQLANVLFFVHAISALA